MALPVVTAAQSDSLVEGMGARTAVFEGAGSAYLDLNAVRDAFAFIGLRYSREQTVLPSTNATIAGHQQSLWGLLAGIGCRTVSRIGSPDGSAGTVSQYADYFKAQWGSGVSSVFWGIENGNEWNAPANGPGIGIGSSPENGSVYSASYPLWAEQLALRQRQMWTTFQGDPQLANLAICGPPLAGARTEAQTFTNVCNTVYGGSTGIQTFATHSNFHLYPGGASAAGYPTTPSWQLDNKVASTKLQAPNRPIVCTEGGMHNAMLSTNKGMSAHSQTAAGLYAPRLTLEHLSRGVLRQWYFELVDDYPDPYNNTQESQFGLFKNDWSPKPAARAWQRMAALFADPGPAFTPPGLAMSISGPATPLRTMLFQKRDGTALLALWRDVCVYDYNTKQDLAIAGQNVTVSLDKPSHVQLYRPSRVDGVFKDMGLYATAVTIPLSGDVAVLKIT